MAGLLTADMAREGLRPLIQCADKPKLTHAEVSEFLEGADFVAAFIQSYWQHAQSLINRGGERRTIGAAFKELAAWIDDCVLAYRKVRADAQKLNFADCDLADLDKTVQALETIKDTVASEVDWLETSAPETDAAKIPAVEAAPTAPGFVGLDEFAARLRARNSA